MKQEIKNIYLLGSGNVATQLGRALKKAGFQISGIFSRNRETGQALASELGSAFTDDAAQINKDAEVYILAVKDDAIAKLAEVLHLDGKIVTHTSGTVEAGILEKISSRFGVFYPLQTFRKSQQTYWKNLPVCIEGADVEVEEALAAITKAIKATPYFISSEKRRKLHLAAVWVNNFTNYMLSVAEEICNTEELPFSILEPLAGETIRKAFAEGPFKSQSGPALRGDAGTLTKHLKMLEGQNANEENEENDNKMLYILLSKAIRNKHKVIIKDGNKD